MTYKIDHQKLRALIESRGSSGLAEVSAGAKMIVSMLYQMSNGTYKSCPRAFARERLCQFLDVPISDIFKKVPDKTG